MRRNSDAYLSHTMKQKHDSPHCLSQLYTIIGVIFPVINFGNEFKSSVLIYISWHLVVSEAFDLNHSV